MPALPLGRWLPPERNPNGSDSVPDTSNATRTPAQFDLPNAPKVVRADAMSHRNYLASARRMAAVMALSRNMNTTMG